MFNCNDVVLLLAKPKTEVLKWLCTHKQHIMPSSSNVM